LSALAGLAIYDQIVRAPEHRTWEGVIFLVPYDFRMPTLARLQQRFWNADDPRIFTPHVFGVGWSLNVYQVLHKLR
jgi:hypothetical protein